VVDHAVGDLIDESDPNVQRTRVVVGDVEEEIYYRHAGTIGFVSHSIPDNKILREGYVQGGLKTVRA
jgi:hypothetical protein